MWVYMDIEPCFRLKNKVVVIQSFSLSNDKALNTVLEMSSDVKRNNKINAYDNFELGLKMYSLKKYNAALTYFNKSIEIDSKNAKVFFYRAMSKARIVNNPYELESACLDAKKALKLGYDSSKLISLICN